MAQAQQRQQQQERPESVSQILQKGRSRSSTNLVYLFRVMCPSQIQSLGAKINDGSLGRGRQVGGCPLETAQFWANGLETPSKQEWIWLKELVMGWGFGAQSEQEKAVFGAICGNDVTQEQTYPPVSKQR